MPLTEDEVNIKVRDWLIAQGYIYKGILNKGKGQVPVPVEPQCEYIDHQGEKLNPPERLWVEAKGSHNSVSDFLQGFIRLTFAIWYGGGDGLLALPEDGLNKILAFREFLERVAIATMDRGKIGLFNADTNEVTWL